MSGIRYQAGYPEIGGAVAQLGERLLCKQEVVGSIPISSTNSDVSDQMSDVGLGRCSNLISDL